MTNLDQVPKEKLDSFCIKWNVEELSLFGSILREDFHTESDIDVLVSFLPDASWTLFDHVDMKQDLETIFNRKVDLVTRKAVEKSKNLIRKKGILDSAKRVYFRE